MDLQDTLKTYRLFSGSYDVVFGPIFHPGRKAAVRIANDRPRQKILEARRQLVAASGRPAEQRVEKRDAR